MAEYEANADAVRVKTEKLRALRLARDAAMPPPAPAKATKAKSAGGKAAGGKAAGGKAAGGKASGGKSAKAKKDDSGKLSDWIKNQQNSGHNY
jgi:hypothetical protein